tara:strand:- start:615 stop:998 length:384 start_codon:yes stop_codon:yes gene_type:complete
MSIYAGSDDLTALNSRLKMQDPDYVLSTLGTGYQGFYDSGDLIYDKNNNKFMWATKDSKPLLFSTDDDANVVTDSGDNPNEPTDKELEARKALIDLKKKRWQSFGDSLMDMAQQNNVAYQYDIFGDD